MAKNKGCASLPAHYLMLADMLADIIRLRIRVEEVFCQHIYKKEI